MARFCKQGMVQKNFWCSRQIVIAAVMCWSLMSSNRGCPFLRWSSTPSTPWLPRRRALLTSPLIAATVSAGERAYAVSGDCGYPVCRTQEAWQQILSKQQFYILRRDGTEAPRSSPLVKEQREGQFKCAACAAPLFSSADKFDSRTGWPSFAEATSNVEVEQSWFESITGTRVKCSKCGSHVGERFLDGMQFPGTRAKKTGRRYCINGAGLVFFPADGSAACSGEAPVKDAVEYWEQKPWRMIDGGLRPI